MKKLIIIYIIGILYLFPLNTTAGTYITGMKYWEAKWDSAILDWFEEDIAISFEENRLQFSGHKSTGDGYLAGPLIGYQTDDQKWSFSFAPMVFSSFDQDWSGAAGPMALNTKVDLERMDFDFAASYTLSKYLRVYAGYKYQDMNMDFILSYGTTMGNYTLDYDVESTVHMPTIGLGGVYPVHEKAVLGLQAGLLYCIPHLEVKEASFGTENIKPWPELGFNVEGSITYKPFKDFIFQAGYRYQTFKLTARGPGRMNVSTSYDVTYGLTLSVLYVF
jgi:hypothetical protein